MATLQQESELRALAKLVDKKLRRMYGQKMGFFLVVSPFHESNAISDYISSMHRDSGIELLRETADRLETNQTIPASKGTIQ